MTDRHSIVPAVWMIIRNQQTGQVFLLRRHNTGWRDGYWTVPAGHVDKGEGPIAAAIRELKEEVGVNVSPSDLDDPLVYFYIADDRLHERVSLFFEVKAYEGEPRNMESHKADAGEWFDLDNLPEKIVPLLKRALIDLPNRVKYSERYYNDDFHKELLQ